MTTPQDGQHLDTRDVLRPLTDLFIALIAPGRDRRQDKFQQQAAVT